jgi:hypothetical protein
MTNGKQKSKADRIRDAMSRAEEAAADLLYSAENWSLQNRTMYDVRNHRRDLLRAARRYSRAMEAITRVRT